ncbi:MAG TPA: APC family permease [Mycobacteriales bacterium]|nr:APC family permease [Mycobacteriales bacterium]
MTRPTATSPSVSTRRRHTGSLAAGTMSGPEVMAQSVAGIAPSAVMATGPALVAGSAGAGALYAYVAATLVLLLVGWCVTQFARRHNSAGSLYEWIGMAFGKGTGFLGGTGLVIGYVGIAVASLAGAVLFLGSLLGSAGVDVTSTSASLAMYVVLGALAALAMVRGIQLSTRVGLVLEVLSIGAIVGVVVVVLAQSGLSSAPWHPAGGISASGVALGMVLAILGFVGFESAASLGVEARDPRRMVPRAVIGSAALAGLLYLLSAYTQLIGFDGDIEALSTSASALNELAGNAGVAPLGHVIDAGATLSFFACVTGSLNAAARTVFSMGRDDLLGGKLGSVHDRHRTPHVALYALTGLAMAVPVVLTLTGLTALEILGYVGTVGTFGYMLAYLLVSVATPVWLRRVGAPSTAAVVVGGLAALGMLYVFYRSVWPVPAWPYNVLPYVFLALLVPALVRYTVVRRRRVLDLDAPTGPW